MSLHLDHPRQRLPAAPRSGNALLASLPRDERERLSAHCELVELAAGELLCEVGQRLGHVYFPIDALVSQLAVADGRMTLEVAAAGSEGMVGAEVGLGRTVAPLRAVVQHGGTAWRMPAGDFMDEAEAGEGVQRMLLRYLERQLASVIEVALCSRFHVLEGRLARTLMLTRDRLQSDHFHMTHEFLAHALGVRRVGVTKAASALQQQGLISYSRGNIAILDPAGLARTACCYHGLQRT